MTDTHAHIYLPVFDSDRDELISRAREANISGIMMPNIDLTSLGQMNLVANKYAGYCLPMIGLHPCSVGADYMIVLDQMEKLLRSGVYFGIGETGCDMYWDKTFRKEQMHALQIQAGWAAEMNLPLVIHARDAFDEIFEVLDVVNCPDLNGVFHCFTGTAKHARKIMDYSGFMLGIGGVVTYKNSDLPSVIKEIDPKKILLETDSPYLPPAPHRGKRNEPSFLSYISLKVAECLEMSQDDLNRQTDSNARSLFKLNTIG